MRLHIKARMPIPETIAGAPQLRDDLRWVWDAFSDLTTERAPGMMGPPGHIPWRAIYAWCQANNLRGRRYRYLKDLVKAMDDAYLEHVAKEIERGRDKDGDA